MLCLLVVMAIITAFLPALFHVCDTDADSSADDYSVYCMGDCLSRYYWPSQLGTLLGPSCTVVKKGVDGNTTQMMLDRFATDVLNQTPHPDYLVVMGGINDVGRGYAVSLIEGNLQSMYTQAHNAGIKVIALTITPYSGQNYQANKKTINLWIMNTAVDVDYRVDVYSLLEYPSGSGAMQPAYTTDGEHLNSAGGQVFAQAIYDAVFAIRTPTIESVSPSQGYQGQTINVTIMGSNLLGATSVDFGSGITTGTFTVVSTSEISANIIISADGVSIGRTISVTTPSAVAGLPNGFTVLRVNHPPGQPEDIAPSNGATGISLTPELISSAFSDPDAGDTHEASLWEISTTSGDYSTPVLGVTSPTELTSYAVPSGTLNQNTTYYWHVLYADNCGDWSTPSAETSFSTVAASDSTPPSTPVVADDGASTARDSDLHATWISSDPESGIAEYWYAIGIAAGGTDVVGWTSMETATEVTKTGLNLTRGTTYYFSVKAKNGASLWSSVGTSDGIAVVAEGAEGYPTVGSIIQTTDGRTTIEFPAGAVTGAVTATVTQMPAYSITAAPRGFEAGSTCFTVQVVDINGNPIVTFAEAVTITVEYSDEDVLAAGGDPNDLVLAYYDETAGEWKSLDTTVNTSDNTLSTSTSHLSTWAVMVKTTSASNGLSTWIWVVIGLASVLVMGADVYVVGEKVASADTDSADGVSLRGAVDMEGIDPVGQDATLDSTLQGAGVIRSGEGPLELKVAAPGSEVSPSLQTPEEEQIGKININSATAAELDSLSGIGPAKAQAIICYRNQNGQFHTLDDLLNVRGIGLKTLETIRNQITVIGHSPDA